MPTAACRIVTLLRNVANTAMPSASPTWRTVVFVPLATPVFSGSMSERMTFVSCELAKPTPSPNSTMPGSSCENVTVGGDDAGHERQPDRFEREPDADDARDAAPAREPAADRRAERDAHALRDHPQRRSRSAERCSPSCSSTGITNSNPNCPIASTIVVSEPVAEAEVPQLAELEQRIALLPFLSPFEHDERGEDHDRERERDRDDRDRPRRRPDRARRRSSGP